MNQINRERERERVLLSKKGGLQAGKSPSPKGGSK